MFPPVRRPFACLLLLMAPLHAIQLRRRLPRFHHQAQSIGTRNRVHVNRLIAEPGAFEMEIGASFSEFRDNANPALLKYTAAGDSLLLGRTEYSVGFDYAHNSNDVTLAANSLLYDGERWNVSLGPSLTIARQNGAGLRAGATAIVRDRGLASLGAEGWRGRLTLNGNALSEHASSTRAVTSTFEGLEWEITRRVSTNLVVQQLDWHGPSRDNQAFAGLTVNFGRVRLH